MINIQNFIALGKRYGFIMKDIEKPILRFDESIGTYFSIGNRHAIALYATDCYGEAVEWITYYVDTDSITIFGDTKQCHLWFCNTRPDLTADLLISFIEELNCIFADTKHQFTLQQLINPTDWQVIADVLYAWDDVRYTQAS